RVPQPVGPHLRRPVDAVGERVVGGDPVGVAAGGVKAQQGAEEGVGVLAVAEPVVGGPAVPARPPQHPVGADVDVAAGAVGGWVADPQQVDGRAGVEEVVGHRVGPQDVGAVGVGEAQVQRGPVGRPGEAEESPLPVGGGGVAQVDDGVGDGPVGEDRPDGAGALGDVEGGGVGAGGRGGGGVEGGDRLQRHAGGGGVGGGRGDRGARGGGGRGRWGRGGRPVVGGRRRRRVGRQRRDRGVLGVLDGRRGRGVVGG